MNVGWLFTGKKMDAWGPWNDKVKALSRKKNWPKILYSAKVYFKNEGKIKTLSDKRKLREFITNRATLQKCYNSLARREIILDGNLKHQKQ